MRDPVYPNDSVSDAILLKIDGDIGELFNRVESLEQGVISQIQQGHNGGFDADKVDGKHASEFVSSSSFTASSVLNMLLGVDGHGSRLDADTVDGVHASSFAINVNFELLSSSTTLMPGKIYYVGQLTNPISVSVSGSPNVGDIIMLCDPFGVVERYPVTISNVKVSGVVINYSFDVARAMLTLRYVSSSIGWIVF